MTRRSSRNLGQREIDEISCEEDEETESAAHGMVDSTNTKKIKAKGMKRLVSNDGFS